MMNTGGKGRGDAAVQVPKAAEQVQARPHSRTAASAPRCAYIIVNELTMGWTANEQARRTSKQRQRLVDTTKRDYTIILG